MSRHILTLTRSNRAIAHRGVDKAPDGFVLELREARRSDAQNSALWSLLGQIQKQRPIHNCVRMTTEMWKAVFMNAAGVEGVFLPTLEGDGLFAAGFRSSKLTKGEFAQLLEVILAWTAREGIQIEHFDDTSSPTARAPATAKNGAGEAVSA